MSLCMALVFVYHVSAMSVLQFFTVIACHSLAVNTKRKWVQFCIYSPHFALFWICQVILTTGHNWCSVFLAPIIPYCLSALVYLICLSVIYIRYQFLDEAFQNQKGIIETFMAKLQEKRNFVHFSATQVQSRYEIILGVCYCREVVTENGVCGIMLPMLQFCFPVTLARNWEY